MRKKRYTQLMGLLVSEEMHKEITELCDEKDLSVSQWIRSAIESKLSQEGFSSNDKIENIKESK